MTRSNRLARFAIISAAALSAACSQMAPMQPMGPKAQAAMAPTQGNTAAGRVMFHQHGGQMMVMVRLSGLKPNAEHGFHIHEKGDCTSGDGMGTGGHFNPTGKPHGPPTGERHAGDLPALKADANGKVDTSFAVAGISLGAGAGADVLGRGLIVHAGPDDYTTQPTGNSGARIACGVITLQ